MPSFPKWRGVRPADPFNGKAVLDFAGAPVFTEEFVSRTASSRWMDGGVDRFSYRRTYVTSYQLAERIDLPAARQERLARIPGSEAYPTGCWDAFAGRNAEILFAECKRLHQDLIRPSQNVWLQKALAAALAMKIFLIVTWRLLAEWIAKIVAGPMAILLGRLQLARESHDPVETSAGISCILPSWRSFRVGEIPLVIAARSTSA